MKIQPPAKAGGCIPSNPQKKILLPVIYRLEPSRHFSNIRAAVRYPFFKEPKGFLGSLLVGPSADVDLHLLRVGLNLGTEFRLQAGGKALGKGTVRRRKLPIQSVSHGTPYQQRHPAVNEPED